MSTTPEGQTLYYILSGTVTVELVDETGSNPVAVYLKAGDIVNIEAWFNKVWAADADFHPTNKVTETECYVIAIPMERLRQLLKGPYKHQEDFILSFLMRSLLAMYHAMFKRVAGLTNFRAEDRVLAALYALAPKTAPGAEVKVHVSRERLARAANCNRITAGQCINALVLKGVIKKEGHSLIIPAVAA